MDRPLIPLHENELPKRIDIAHDVSGLNHRYGCTFFWDDGHTEFFVLHGPDLGKPNYVKLFVQELKDCEYIGSPIDDHLRRFERVKQLGLEGLG